jgi:meiotically up-regulated gene 157 (Mug157) protein
MKKQVLGPYIIGSAIIGSAIIWGVSLIGASLMMRGFEDKAQVLTMLSACAGIHLILIWGPLAAALKKLRTQQDDEQSE